eukprot:CAMPEP_0195155276 /NCGR_PEP_ID=MMETSP0448-20130528/184076_1 /TAXON_ID=66468 /ORGANISM="Heterocapsa triquestra, Strain CCMP 448" /LENGTH=392 /DNA_ID=CAMNT_0040194061 /DNA_START=107 /DNA_END=1285 /DNA_ORIENTATION=+
MKRAAVLGAGNGGKATAADLTLQGVSVRLFELPEFAEANLSALRPPHEPVLRCVGEQLSGTARLELVTDDLATALGLAGLDGGASVPPVDTIFLCTVVQAQETMARLLAPLLASWPTNRSPLPSVVLNPGSTGGSLIVAKIWRELAVPTVPLLCEFGTLTYGCRAKGAEVNVAVKVQRVSYGVFPAERAGEIGPELERFFPGLFRCPTVLAAGLCNANPVIHPSITLLNLGYMENQGDRMRFYADGASPMVSNMIEALDNERLAIMRALGYGEVAEPDHTNSVRQGYAESDSSYYETYGRGKGFGTFKSPSTDCDLAKHRYLQEDIGCGLVFHVSLARVLGVPVPVSEAIIRIGTVVSGDDFIAKQAKTVATLGLDGLDAAGISSFLQTGHA